MPKWTYRPRHATRCETPGAQANRDAQRMLALDIEAEHFEDLYLRVLRSMKRRSTLLGLDPDELEGRS